MTDEITPYISLTELGALADQYARLAVFEAYRERKAQNTRDRHRVDLRHFEDYLKHKGVKVGALYDDPEAWRGVSWGLLDGFRRSMLQQGAAIGTINTRMTTVRKYAELAFAAGVLTHEQHLLIQSVRGVAYKEGINIDKERPVTRTSKRKEKAPTLSNRDRRRLKTEHADDGQGLRDALMMCLLLDHGLRASELTALKVSDVNIDAGMMTFWRPKVALRTTHVLTPDTADALARYQAGGLLPDPEEPLLRKSIKSGVVTESEVGRRSLTKRVRVLGKRILGLPNLAAHDCRHSWATEYARNHSEFELQEAGGWSSLAMPRRYVEMMKIAHDGKAMD
jgi:integrase